MSAGAQINLFKQSRAARKIRAAGLNSGDVLLTRAFPRARPAARAGLTIYVARLPAATSLTAGGVPPRRATSRRAAQKCKSPAEINPAGLLVLATSYSRTAYRRTTIGAAAFHCRVRNGDGWGHCAMITRTERRNVRRSVLVRDSKLVTSEDSPVHGSRITIHASVFKEQVVL